MPYQSRDKLSTISEHHQHSKQLKPFANVVPWIFKLSKCTTWLTVKFSATRCGPLP